MLVVFFLQVGDPMSYHRESWMMEKDEKLTTVPLLHMQGNALVRQRQFREAASKYKEAVLLLKTVQSRVSPDQIGVNCKYINRMITTENIKCDCNVALTFIENVCISLFFSQQFLIIGFFSLCITNITNSLGRIGAQALTNDPSLWS